MDIKEIFKPEIIEYYKTNKSEITKELLDQLRNSGNEGKQIALDILDTEKSEDNYYLDAFGNKISFLGDRNLKKAFTQMKLSQIHIDEIKRCSEDLNYFMDNYIKIRTKKGYDFAELRSYQQRFLDVLNSDSESIVAMLGRQCISGETLITLETAKASIETLFQECSKVAYPLNQEFTETRIPKGLKVLTPLGFREIEYIHKTIPYRKYRIRTENGLTLECAERHVIIDKDNSEVYASESLGIEVQTVKGISKVIECQDLGETQAMYDISIKHLENAENTELYYTNGILSHNSGKSVTVAIFMAWHFNFNHNLNIGICANKGSLAREFLNNIKEMFYSIPMWMRQGITSWSKSTIESELKMRVLTDVPGENSFRGFSISLLCVDETAWIPPDKFHALMDSLLPSQAAMSWKKNIFISTPNGMNHFYELVEGARKRKILYGLSKAQLEKTEKVLSWKQTGEDSYDVTVNEPSNNHALFEMDWRDVPRYNSKGQRLDPEEFKNDIITKYGLTYFSQNFACVSGDTKVKVLDSSLEKETEIPIQDLYRNPRNVLIKTQSGYSDFKGIRKLEAKVLRICFNDTHIDVSEDHRFVVFGTEITAKTLKVGDILQTETGTAIITEIQAVQEQKDVYDVLDTKDHTYITNNLVSHNCDFIGSSHTLISPNILKELKAQEPEMILANRLKVYKEPEEKHKYIMGVDPAKFGSDSFAIQVLDVTTFPFIQVASAKLPDENFQIMPQYLYEWGKWYNEALMIIESNDGAGTYANTVLHNDYEYENLYFEKTFGTFDHKTKTKIEPGFRTNAKNRAMILDTLKLLIDNKRLAINDKDTIKEFTTFVLKNNKFQADDGFHDDLIMALCIALAPFSDVKNFENFTELVSKMYSKDAESVDFSDFLCLGDFDDYSDLEVSDDTPESILFEIQSKSLRGF